MKSGQAKYDFGSADVDQNTCTSRQLIQAVQTIGLMSCCQQDSRGTPSICMYILWVNLTRSMAYKLHQCVVQTILNAGILHASPRLALRKGSVRGPSYLIDLPNVTAVSTCWRQRYGQAHSDHAAPMHHAMRGAAKAANSLTSRAFLAESSWLR